MFLPHRRVQRAPHPLGRCGFIKSTPLEGQVAPSPWWWCLLGDLCFLYGFWLVTCQSNVSYLRFRGVTKCPTQACTIPGVSRSTVRLAYSECWKERNELRDCDTERCGKKRHGVNQHCKHCRNLIKKCPMTCFLCGGEITRDVSNTRGKKTKSGHLRMHRKGQYGLLPSMQCIWGRSPRKGRGKQWLVPKRSLHGQKTTEIHE